MMPSPRESLPLPRLSECDLGDIRWCAWLDGNHDSRMPGESETRSDMQRRESSFPSQSEATCYVHLLQQTDADTTAASQPEAPLSVEDDAVDNYQS
jgi:hypothetical protein